MLFIRYLTRGLTRVCTTMNFEKNRSIAKQCPCGKSNRDQKFAPFSKCVQYGHCHACALTFFPNETQSASYLPSNNPKVEPSFIDRKYLDLSIATAVDNPNNFILSLASRFGMQKLRQLCKDLHIGNSSRWPGCTVFWQVDQNGLVRSGKVVYYNSLTGKRDHSKNDWIHSILSRKGLISNFQLQQCFYGMHQIASVPKEKQHCSTIGIVESAKTVTILTLLYPKVTWMSTESVGGLKKDKMKPLKNFNIILFPDLPTNKLDPFKIWSEKATNWNREGYRISVSDLLLRKRFELNADDGDDIADFL